MPRYKELTSVRHYYVEAMACEFGFHLIGDETRLIDSAVLEAEDLLAKLEQYLSLYIEYSDTSRINRAKVDETIPIMQETVDCLLQAFDASVRLMNKFHPFMGQCSIQSKDQSKELRRFLTLDVDQSDSRDPAIALDSEANTVTKLREGPLLDFGGIGKGFALDRLRAHFLEWDIECGLIESAGSTFLAMKPPSGSNGWDLDIGYEKETKTVSLPDGWALASSGDLFQGSHVIDPESDSTARSWKRSYAIATSGAFADAASTASLLLDFEQLKSLSQKEKDLSFAVYSETENHTRGPFFK